MSSIALTPLPAPASTGDAPPIRIGVQAIVDRTRIHPTLAVLVGVAHVDEPAEVVDLDGAAAALCWPDGYRLRVDRAAVCLSPLPASR